jgi:hypothetical protein
MINKKHFRLNAEVTTIMLENFKKGSFTKQTFSVLPSASLGHFQIFGGPSLNLVNTDTAEGRELVRNYLWNHTNRHDRLTGMYLGYTAGVNIKL